MAARVLGASFCQWCSHCYVPSSPADSPTFILMQAALITLSGSLETKDNESTRGNLLGRRRDSERVGEDE